MNITINAGRFAQELRLINQVVAAKPTYPILSHVLLIANTQLHLQASDLEYGLESICPATIAEPGTIALPAKKLLDMIDQFNGDVQIVYENNATIIKSGAFKSRLQAMPTKDFIPLPTMEGAISVLPAVGFRQMIARTRYAIASSNKYVVEGALLTCTPTGAIMVTTDQKRLSVTTLVSSGVDASAIIPAKALDILTSLNGTGEISFSHSDRRLFFAANNWVFNSKMMDGKYPNWQRMVPNPTEMPTHIDVNRSALAAAIRRVCLVSDVNQAMYLAFSTDTLRITSNSVGIGEADEHTVITYRGMPFTVCLNWKFLLEFLDATDSATIQLSFNDVTKDPMLLRDGEPFLNVIVLMRMSDQ